MMTYDSRTFIFARTMPQESKLVPDISYKIPLLTRFLLYEEAARLCDGSVGKRNAAANQAKKENKTYCVHKKKKKSSHKKRGDTFLEKRLSLTTRRTFSCVHYTMHFRIAVPTS